jgi:hypothetical protein
VLLVSALERLFNVEWLYLAGSAPDRLVRPLLHTRLGAERHHNLYPLRPGVMASGAQLFVLFIYLGRRVVRWFPDLSPCAPCVVSR